MFDLGKCTIYKSCVKLKQENLKKINYIEYIYTGDLSIDSYNI